LWRFTVVSNRGTTMGSIPDAELRSIQHSVFVGVCKSCDFVHGEALKPSGTTCLVQVCDFFCPAPRLHAFICLTNSGNAS
jgi:hypothetical protein